ncbi:hypothetical protein [Corallococcus sp. 4LFB]|uniref:hypothetical protein n=1 Tax=Corallococcus sp. 4LFB TaxID=3383249 RepID=UPI0039750E85
MTRDARLLQVDEGQRVLLSVRADGTYAQALPTGDAVRIADVAEGADITADGQTAVLWSPEVNGVRTVWLWRSGTPEALLLSQQAWGAVVHDATQSYVALLERDAAGDTSVRLARTAACTPGDCVLQTPLQVQVQAGWPELESRGALVSLVNGTHRWLIDVPTGAVTDLGDLPGRSFLSPSGTRYGFVEGERVRLFDIATGTQVLDLSVPHNGYSVWKATRGFMWNEERVFVASVGVLMGAPAGWPEDDFLDVCTAQGCQRLVSRYRCSPFLLGGQPAVGCSPNLCIETRCVLPGNKILDGEGTWLYQTKESDTVWGPAFSQGFTDAVRLKGTKGLLHWLEWTRGEKVSKLNLDAPYPTAPILFLPDKQRVLFHQSVLRDGVAESHLWTWDQSERVDLGLLDGTPGPTRLMRDNPPTAYMDVDTANADGTTTPSIVRVEL